MRQLSVVTLGDSVAWGQGLRPQQKFNHLAAKSIADQLGISIERVKINQYAHSGAVVREPDLSSRLDPNRDHNWPSVPWSTPTVFEQIKGDPDKDIDIVMLTAGINDLGSNYILNPAGTREELEDAIRQNCYVDIKNLVGRARQHFPNAVIIATGYFPMLSEQSDLVIARIMASLLGPVSYLFSGAAAKRITRRARFFARRQLYWLRLAITEQHSDPTKRGPGILFAHPAFGPQHSVGAPQNLLFSPKRPQSLSEWQEQFNRDPLATLLLIEPDDPMSVQRRQACKAFDDRMGKNDMIQCRVAAIGHPNPAGAQRYSDAITSVWQRNHRISLRKDLDKLNKLEGNSTSLRESLEQFGLNDQQLSIRAIWQHMMVDSLAVEISTGQATFAGSNHNVYLQVAPGRKFLLNEKIYDGDLFDDFQSDSTTRYAIDPAEYNAKNRLHLWDIKELKLILQLAPSLPTGSWKPQGLHLDINGRKVFQEEINTSLKVDILDTTDTITLDYPKP